MVLTPGVYCFSMSAGLIGTLTLGLQDNPNAAFLFNIGSTLTTASGSAVALVNSGGTTCPPNVHWQVGSSATLGTGSTARPTCALMKERNWLWREDSNLRPTD
jgi:hypothetical protein